MASAVLHYLITLVCFSLTASQSYISLKDVILNHGTAKALPAKCLPTCEDSNGNTINGTHIRDPSSCKQYWVCLPDGTRYDQPHVCQDEEIVNIDKLVCELKINDGTDQCTIPDPDCDSSIPKVCYHKDTCPPSGGGINPYADEGDCNKYHICHFDATLSCEAITPYFNGQECVSDPKQCCNCQALCTTTWATIPDPKDATCESYYLCQGLDTSISGCMTSMECSNEGYFPRCTNVCDAGFFQCSASSVTEKATIEPQFCMNDQVFDPSTSRCIPPAYCHSMGYIASEEEKFSCADGETYDAINSECSASATCTPTCSSSPAPSTLSPTTASVTGI